MDQILVVLDREAVIASPLSGYVIDPDDAPLTEPCTVKLSQPMTEELLAFCRRENYAKLGPGLRELIRIGLKYHAAEAYKTLAKDRERYAADPIVQEIFLRREGNLVGHGVPGVRLPVAAEMCPPRGEIWRISRPDETRVHLDTDDALQVMIRRLTAVDFAASDWTWGPKEAADGRLE